MVQIPWPYTHAPGEEAQEGAGRLINVFVERRGDEQSVVWRRAPGTEAFAREPSAGTANGSATALGISSIKLITGSASGTATAVAIGSVGQIKQIVGSAGGTSSAEAVAVGSVEDMVGSASGISEAIAVGST